MKPNQHVTFALKLAGWEFEGPVPSQKKYVLLAVPHTSNWDGILLLLAARSVGVELSWMVKDSMARGPMRPLMRQLNAVPIDRSRANNVVQAMADEFARRDRFVLAIPPEGTRSRVEYWKSGFTTSRAQPTCRSRRAIWILRGGAPASVIRSISPATSRPTWIASARSTSRKSRRRTRPRSSARCD